MLLLLALFPAVAAASCCLPADGAWPAEGLACGEVQAARSGDAAAASRTVDQPGVAVGDSPAGNAERLALRIEKIQMDMHLNADTGAVTTRARMRVRNGGGSPLGRVALQVSSALLWQSARTVDANGGGMTLPVTQYQVTTDTDHTGAAHEMVLALPKPLAPGTAVDLDLYYGGTLRASAERLLRLGAPDTRALGADWDGVSAEFVGLRGFGNVLWFPVSAPAALLADGDAFARTVTAERERTAGTTLELSLTLEHTGAAFEKAWFVDRAAALQSPLQRRAPAAEDSGADEPVLETAHWEPVRLDGRPVSLFVAAGEGSPAVEDRSALDGADSPQVDGHSAVADGASSAIGGGSAVADGSSAAADGEATSAGSGAAGAGRVVVVGGDAAVRRCYAEAADKVAPLVRQWLPGGGTLTVLALPSPGAQAFADGGLLVAPVRATDPAALAEALVYPAAAAALPGDAPAWVREGVPEFLRLLYLAQTGGRDRMLSELSAAVPALRAAEASRGMDPAPLRSCVDPVCARNKAAYALVMLRGLVGDTALQEALRVTLAAGPDATPTDGTAEGGRAMTRRFESAVAQSSGKNLQWFFDDWFAADRGLPDLEIVEVAPRRVERGAASVTAPVTKRPVAGPIGAEPEAEADDPRRTSPTAASRNAPGLPEGSWLVAVEVQNNGDAVAEVPVTVRSEGLQNTLPMRVPAHGRATVRVPFETAPEEVFVNDGTVPEQRAGVHHRAITVTQGAR